MAHRSKAVLMLIWIMIFIMGLYIIGFGVKNFSDDIYKNIAKKLQENVLDTSMEYSAGVLFPVIECALTNADNTSIRVSNFFSMYGYLHPYSYEAVREEVNVVSASAVSSNEGIDSAISIVAGNITDWVNIDDFVYEDETTETVSEITPTDTMESAVNKENEDAVAANAEINNNGIEENKEIKGIDYDANTLSYDFLINNFYTVDSTTNITKEQLDASKLLGMDMKIKSDSSKPQILIYHTHSQEGFVDSKANDSSTTVVGVGEELTRILKEKYGFNVIHDTTCYDLIDGKIDRNKAYSLACANVSRILKENPSIEVVIDLHRDGIEGEKLVTEIDGKQMAKVMFFNGLSYTNKNGKIGYLENPYIGENLSLSLKLQIEAAKYYPGLMRKIYLKGYRYNLHLKPKALLIEAGAQNNTLQEELNAMEPLADILARVLL